MDFIKLNEKEAKYIQVLDSVGLSPITISKKFGYKYTDIINVLRGNTFNHVTGILKVDVPADKVIEISYLLKIGVPYKKVATITKINENKIRNIRGYMKYLGLIK